MHANLTGNAENPEQTVPEMRCKAVKGIYSGLLGMIALVTLAGYGTAMESPHCREDRVVAKTGSTVSLACDAGSGRGEALHAGDIVPVFREHHYGRGESPLFYGNHPNRMREVGKVRVIPHDNNGGTSGNVLEGPLRTGDVIKMGSLTCVICTVVCDNIRKESY